MQTRYDPRTAVTFLLAGVGVGAMLALIFAPRHPSIPLPTNRHAGDRMRGIRPAEPSLSRAV
jgi:hypothetical protein